MSDRNGAMPSVQTGLRVAMPKGRMAQMAYDLFEEAGIGLPADGQGRKLIIDSTDGSLRYVLAKPTDVPTYVEYGAADLGICGLDTLRESRRNVYEPLLLPFGFCRLSLCAPVERPETPLRYASQPRVATKYPNLTMDFFRERGVNAEVIPLNGSVELGPLVGLADLIVDVVETGNTLRANGLCEIRTLLSSQAVLIINRSSFRVKADSIQPIIAKLRSTISARAGQGTPIA